jgi:putative DNA methylase
MTIEDRRLIEDYLPIKAISKEASREKSIRKGHISTLHLWWARRPLVACRAAVYGVLVPEDQFRPKNGPPEKRKSLGRANAAKFLERLCKYPGNPQAINEAERHILEAHAERLTNETGEKVTLEDIEQGRAPRPKVLDMFAGGGAIPLEALRLGCEAYALDLNPVAHIIELCTLVYPQKYGKPDPSVRGMTGPKNKHGEKTWGGLADEVRYWGEWVLEKVREEIGDLYPPIPDPEYKGKRPEIEFKKGHWVEKGKKANALEECTGVKNDLPHGYLTPVAYLWTRTVKCKNPSCVATIPLVRQTWLCKKKGRYVALKMKTPKGGDRVTFQVVEAKNDNELGFDPKYSTSGNATCPYCGTVADSYYIKIEGCAKRIGLQMMAVACANSKKTGKYYFSANDLPKKYLPDTVEIEKRIDVLSKKIGLSVPSEKLVGKMTDQLPAYGMDTFRDVFTARQMLSLLLFARYVSLVQEEMSHFELENDRALAISSYLGLLVSRMANFNSSVCLWNYTGGRGVVHSFGRQALAMTWDFPESNPFNNRGANWEGGIESSTAVVKSLIPQKESSLSANVNRGSASQKIFKNGIFDAIITDPPYYDNICYADLSDFFYIWLKRSIGKLYPEHFTAELTPKKVEAISSPYAHVNKQKARKFYEKQMESSFSTAYHALKEHGSFVCVYAHKTTLGWATLVDALRRAGFVVVEAWPLNTERTGGFKVDKAMLASSIFLVARKRNGAGIGSYENQVRSELQQVVQESVEKLWVMGVAGADLVIAAVGAGLRAFTRFARVEYENGEEVLSERFLYEVETVVLETILKQLSKEVGANGDQFSLAGVDVATRFYILWRYAYKYSVLNAGEAIIFANGSHVELDGSNGLSSGSMALLEKKKGKYRLKDFSDRGSDKKLGLMMEDGQAAPMIDILHRTLWLMENRPGELPAFLREAQPNREQMRLVAQALAGPALKGGELGSISPHAELSALTKLTANWKSVIEDAGLIPVEKKAREAGQRSLFK